VAGGRESVNTMDNGTAVLEGEHLRHTFGEGDKKTVAVNEVSLTVRPREIALIMGPSGSGKSTLLAILSGLLRPQRGKVKAMGEDLWALPERARKAFRLRNYGFVFQGFNLFPALTAWQQLEIVLRWGQHLPRREIRKRIDAMLGLLDLTKQARHLPAQLSGGEKQRVAVARALIKEPTVCFADEPTSSLDWPRGRQVIDMLCQAAQRKGSAVLVVSHDPRLIPFMDRVYSQEEGRLRERQSSAGLPEYNEGGGI
jgi:putative ABC transport system ATP-binding protein